jgi:prepilin-type N-terminal cleavage/methylation domain-containing protein
VKLVFQRQRIVGTFRKEHGQHGFSMVELLIVVAIILIIAAVAIPNLLRSKISANEAAAASTLKSIGTSNVLYSSLYNLGFAGTLRQLGPVGGGCGTISSGCAGLLDSTVAGVTPATPTPIKSGYIFTYSTPNATPTATMPNSSYSIVASPVGPGSTGVSTFCMDGGNIYVIWRDTSGGTTTATALGCAPAWVPGGTVGPL